MSGDVAAILACFEPDVVFFGSGDGEQAVGHVQLDAMLRMRSQHAKGGTFTITWESLVGDRLGDIGFVRGVGRVRSSGTLAKFDGTAYRVTGVLCPP